jgi:hypothetical protein
MSVANFSEQRSGSWGLQLCWVLFKRGVVSFTFTVDGFLLFCECPQRVNLWFKFGKGGAENNSI